MLLNCFLNNFEIVPIVPVITGIIFAFTFHMCCISVVRFLYFRIFWAFFFITDYDVQFIVEDGPAGLHVLIPWYFSS